MAKPGIDELLERLREENRAQAAQAAGQTPAQEAEAAAVSAEEQRGRELARELLGRAVLAGLTSGDAVRVGGTPYTLVVERERETDDVETRVASSLLRAGHHTVSLPPRGPESDAGHDAAVAAFLVDYPAVVRGFADMAIRRMYDDLHPSRSLLRRLRVASRVAARAISHNRLKLFSVLVPAVVVAIPPLIGAIVSLPVATMFAATLGLFGGVMGRDIFDTAHADAERNQHALRIRTRLGEQRLASVEALDSYARTLTPAAAVPATRHRAVQLS